MKATVVDMRYRMTKVLEALDNREQVQILYHGKVKGVIHPAGQKQARKAAEHPFFGSLGDEPETVAQVMERLRGGRHGAL